MSTAGPDRETRKAPKPSAKLTDASNNGKLELKSHQRVRDSAISAAEASKNVSAAASSKRKKATVEEVDDEESHSAPKASSSKRPRVIASDEEIEEVPAPTSVDAPLVNEPPESEHSEPEAPTVSSKDRTKDVDAFFHPAVRIGGKPRRACILCKDKGSAQTIVNEATTLRRHIESHHLAKYNTWCEKNNFESKLPKVVKARNDAKAAEDRSKQSTLDPHLEERPKETFVPYSDALFREAAIEWLIATDQPIQALDHPRFKRMIDIAARATKGVKIPTRKATRKHIIELFKKNLDNLRIKITSDNTGLISLTCDAWQAGNQDAYFAVTGHWTEEVSPGVWEDCSALVGFTKMNSAHDGIRLGRALFKIVKHLGFAHKVGWITCDNASNNLTMLRHFGRVLNASNLRKGLKSWDHEAFHIRCLAHVINLATQALLAAHSSTKHYNPANPTEHEPEVDGYLRALQWPDLRYL